MSSSDSNADNSDNPSGVDEEIIEIPVPTDDAARDSNVEKSKGNWLGRILVFVSLITIAVLGFGSSAGWFDFSGSAPTDVDLPPTVAADVSGLGTSSPIPDQTSADQQMPAVSSSGNLPGQGPTGSNLALQSPAESLPPLNALMPTESKVILEECNRVVKHLINVLPGSPAAREMAARIEYEFGDMEKARELWKQLLDENPSFVYALRGLGDICTSDGDLEEAVTYFRRAVVADPENVTRQITLAVALTQAGEFEQAKEVLKTVIERVPDHGGAQLELGNVLSQLSDFEGAREHFELSLKAEIPPSDVSKAHFGLIKVFRRLEDNEKAKYHQAEYQKLQDTNTDTRQEGRRDYDDLQAISEDVGNFYVDMARVYLSSNLPKSAELLLLRASEMNPKNVDCRQALGFIALRQGKFFDAIRWLKELAALVPKEFSFAQEVARIYVQLGQPNDAEKVLTDFAQANPENGVALRSISEFYIETDLGIDQAIEYCKQATEAAPTAENFELLASLYAKTQKVPEAIQYFERAAELDPNNVTYSQTILLLKDELTEDAAGEEDRP